MLRQITNTRPIGGAPSAAAQLRPSRPGLPTRRSQRLGTDCGVSRSVRRRRRIQTRGRESVRHVARPGGLSGLLVMRQVRLSSGRGAREGGSR